MSGKIREKSVNFEVGDKWQPCLWCLDCVCTVCMCPQKGYSVLNGLKLQSTLVISNSVISNNRLSQGENLVPVLTWKSNNR